MQNLLIIVENVLWERISVIDLNCCTEIVGSVKVVLISDFSHESFPIWQNNIQYWQQDTKILQFWNLSIKVRRQIIQDTLLQCLPMFDTWIQSCMLLCKILYFFSLFMTIMLKHSWILFFNCLYTSYNILMTNLKEKYFYWYYLVFSGQYNHRKVSDGIGIAMLWISVVLLKLSAIFFE